MLGTTHLWLFVVSGLLLNITPGPDTLYVIGRSSTQGFKAGVCAAIGIGAGVMVHVTAAALGLSAILAASATAFMVVKYIGAAYLIYVGIGLLRSSGQSTPTAGIKAANLRTVFLQGFMTNVLNPKVALFFLAFLPQFVAPDAPSKALAFLFLGVIFDINGTLWSLIIAYSTAALSRRLKPGAGFKRWFNRGVGALFVGVGLRLAWVHERLR